MEKEFISRRFYNIRAAKNISARQLSLELGQSSQYINQIENGHKMPSIEGLINFCNHFEISVAEFFNREEQYPIQYKALIKELNRLDSDEVDEIMTIAKRYSRNKANKSN